LYLILYFDIITYNYSFWQEKVRDFVRKKRYSYREPVFSNKFTVFLIVLAILSVGTVGWLYFSDTYSGVTFASGGTSGPESYTDSDTNSSRWNWPWLNRGSQANESDDESNGDVYDESYNTPSGEDDAQEYAESNGLPATSEVDNTEANDTTRDNSTSDNSGDDVADGNVSSDDADTSGEAAQEPTHLLTTVDNSLLPWYLKLVNRDNFLDYYFMPQLMYIGNGHQFDARAYSALLAMIASAEAEGLSPIVVSSFRSVSRQTTLFNNRIQRFVDEGYSQEDAFEAARRIVAYPGTSEHNLGLAVDIVSNNYHGLTAQQAYTPEGIWLAANSYRYGFVLRYPYDKQHITNIIFEPWHFRYVGVYAATEMFARNLVLEEYVSERLAAR